MSPRPIRSRMGALIVVVLLAAPAAFGNDLISEEDVEQHQGVVSAVKALKGRRSRLTVTTDQKESTFTLDAKTLIYQLTPKNRDAFTYDNKAKQIVKDANQYRKRLRELEEAGIDLALEALHQQTTRETVRGVAAEKSERGAQNRSVEKKRGALGVLTQSQLAFTQEEEDRRKAYGMPVKLKDGQKVIIVAMKEGDDTLFVLVAGTGEKKKEVTTPGGPKEGESARKLQRAKQLLGDAERAKGSEHERLLSVAQERLREIVEQYPESPEALEAEKLLADK
jgi:hypothetical protein